MQIDKLSELMSKLSGLQSEATKQANAAIDSLKGKISQEELKELKKISNFEGINGQAEILTRIEKIQEWERKLQR